MVQVNRKYIRFVGIVGLVVAVDQYTKYLVRKLIPDNAMHVVIPHLFNIVHVRNPGGAFGMFAGQSAGFRSIMFIFITLLAVALIVYLEIKNPENYRWLSVGLSLILGGAIGNLIDRLYSGRVTDFLDFYIGSHHWPAFNVADSAITIGMIIFACHILFKQMPTQSAR